MGGLDRQAGVAPRQAALKDRSALKQGHLAGCRRRVQAEPHLHPASLPHADQHVQELGRPTLRKRPSLAVDRSDVHLMRGGRNLDHARPPREASSPPGPRPHTHKIARAKPRPPTILRPSILLEPRGACAPPGDDGVKAGPGVNSASAQPAESEVHSGVKSNHGVSGVG